MAGLHAQLASVSLQPQPRGGGLRGIARGGALNLAGAVVSAGATIGMTLVITRHFSPVAGAFFAATSVFVIVSVVAGLGAANGIVYFVARLRSLGDQGRIPVMLRAAIRPAACVAVLSALAVALAAKPLAGACSEATHDLASRCRAWRTRCGRWPSPSRSLHCLTPFSASLAGTVTCGPPC